jgi:hypothetical protein
MKRVVLACACALLIAVPALGQGAPPAADPAPAAEPAPAAAPQMDMSKVGGASRPVKNEKKVKKELDAFFKAEDAAMKKRDQEASWAMVDYPVLMVTDDSKGQSSDISMTREQYIAEMKPFMEQPPPKNMKYTVKRDVTVLTDSLAMVVGKVTMSLGKKKFSWKNASLVVKKDGKWGYKMMAEGGWGDAMGEPKEEPKIEPSSEPVPEPAP